MSAIRPAFPQPLPQALSRPTSPALGLPAPDQTALCFSGQAPSEDGPRPLTRTEGEFLNLITLNAHPNISEIKNFIHLNKDNPEFSINVQNPQGMTALHFASAQKKIEVVKLLIEEMTPEAISAPNNRGETALHLFASMKGYADIVKLLTKKMPLSAIMATTEEYNPALNLAFQADDKDTVAHLKKLKRIDILASFFMLIDELTGGKISEFTEKRLRAIWGI